MPPYHLTVGEGKQVLRLSVCGSPFVTSCLFFPRVSEPVLFRSLGGQSLLPKNLGSFMKGRGEGGRGQNFGGGGGGGQNFTWRCIFLP